MQELRREAILKIVHGSVAQWQGKKAQEDQTHKWHCYVRGVHPDDDLSFVIKKVIFQLHPTFNNFLRSVDRPPFMVSEVGWGEFEIVIRVHFKDASITPIELFHFLKLYPTGEQSQSTKKHVVSEFYDEIVFPNPPDALYQKLSIGPPRVPFHFPHTITEHFLTNFDEDE
eukprot:CAMPEP_0196664150 /NCGR_PEP_ID=MMETSP1086-20130531/55932_1 /TAXON_ID=77921 /ORGANISM="Cyanoptyche  gloeocystis , Strain SAG4.97" /LENGTH=169 /DNA_ID=CAMNT_0042000321 /DNA_START=100 /DNA_END=606 /DNA_ORIENTATION=+